MARAALGCGAGGDGGGGVSPDLVADIAADVLADPVARLVANWVPKVIDRLDRAGALALDHLDDDPLGGVADLLGDVAGALVAQQIAHHLATSSEGQQTTGGTVADLLTG